MGWVMLILISINDEILFVVVELRLQNWKSCQDQGEPAKKKKKMAVAFSNNLRQSWYLILDKVSCKKIISKR